MNRTHIIAVYASGKYFSGQRFAIEIVIQGLLDRGWNVSVVSLPALDRNHFRYTFFDLFTVFGSLGILIVSWLRVILSYSSIVYVGLGQTKLSLLREGVPLIVRQFIFPRSKSVVSLHGSNFMCWSSTSLEARLLFLILRSVKIVSVLGPSQAVRLKQLNVPKNKVIIVDNTCLTAPLSRSEIVSKHSLNEGSEKVNVLFLSNLIEGKGYIQFVEAIELISRTTSYRNLEITICGKFVLERGASSSFKTTEMASDWIRSKIENINSSPNVKMRWLEGAFGKEKDILFSHAHIFVLPTTYRTEAQPISILEALATGCVVVTTKVGEIASTLNPEVALFLDDTSPSSISSAILNLSDSPSRRSKMALAGLDLFEERFSHTKHLETWDNYFSSI